MILLNSFFEWFSHHRLAGEMTAIAIFITLVGSWIGIAYAKHKRDTLKKEMMKNSLKNKITPTKNK
jgi:hypothetical protein